MLLIKHIANCKNYRRVTSVTDIDYRVRPKAAWALGEIGNNAPEILTLLEKMAEHDTDADARREAKIALHKLR